MLRIDRQTKALKRVEQKPMPTAGLKERSDLQQMIRNDPDAFFAEMGEKMLLIGEEVRPTEVVDDRIDLLAVDQQGAAVIIELKRDHDKLQLLQAIAYAGMVSKWEQTRLAQERASLARKSVDDATEEIEQFILEDVAELNQVQRVVLLAEDFDYEVLVAAEWLSEKYDVDISCFRLALSADGASEYLTCTCIYPPPELAKAAIRRGRLGRPPSGQWTDWDTALADVQNPEVVRFIKAEVVAKRECHLPTRSVIYRFDGKRRLYVGTRRKFAYVWQGGRFEDDQQFWEKRLGRDATPEPVDDGRGLRFYLETGDQFRDFKIAVDQDLLNVNFAGPLSDL